MALLLKTLLSRIGILSVTLTENECSIMHLPPLLYSSVTWRVTDDLQRRQSTQKRYERKTFGTTQRYRKQASCIKKHEQVDGISMTINNKKWSWACHIVLRSDNRQVAKVKQWQFPKYVSQGRQKARHRDDISI